MENETEIEKRIFILKSSEQFFKDAYWEASSKLLKIRAIIENPELDSDESLNQIAKIINAFSQLTKEE